MTNNIRIHKELPSKIVENPRLIKAFAVFYGLKFIYVGGIIINITGRYDEIASKLGISQNNLRGKIKTLLELGLVKREGRNLWFAGFNQIGKTLQTKSKKSYKIGYTNVKALETIIKALAIENNLERQRHKVKEKIVNEELRRYGKIEAKTIRNKIKKYIRKNILFYSEKYQKRVSSKSKNFFSKPKLNTDISISRMGIADMMGRISKSTGSRLVRKMKALNLLESDEKRIERVSNNVGDLITKYLDLDSSYFVFKRSLYKRQTNLLTLNNFFA